MPATDSKSRRRVLLQAIRVLAALLLVTALSWRPGSARAEDGLISLDVRGADIRDVLSALAVEMGATIILDADPVEITFKADNLPPDQVLDLVIQRQGLASAQRGSTIVVGEPDKLKENYFDQMLLTRFDTYYVTPDQVKELISSLGLNISVLSLPDNPQALWVQGTVQSLQKARELVNAVDLPENNQLALLEYRTVTTSQLSPDRVVELLDSAGIKLEHYIINGNQLMVFEKKLFPRWEEVEALIARLDTLDALREKAFVYQLRNVSALDAAARLKLFNWGSGNEVKTITYNNDNLGRELLVICPPSLEGRVRNALASIDLTRNKIKATIASAQGKNSYNSLNNIRNLLSQMSGVSAAYMHISSNLSAEEDNQSYVLWAEESPDKIKQLQDLAASFSSGSGEEGE